LYYTKKHAKSQVCGIKAKTVFVQKQKRFFEVL